MDVLIMVDSGSCSTNHGTELQVLLGTVALSPTTITSTPKALLCRIWEGLEHTEGKGCPQEKLGAGSTPEPQAHPQDQHPHVCHGQVDLQPLAVAGRVRTDPVHLQLPGHVQQLSIRLGRRLPTADTNTPASNKRRRLLKTA